MGGLALTVDDREAMRRAIALAWGGWGRVGGNPLVGALVLRDGEPAGEGFYAAFGERHAEVVALEAAGERARGAELVVTLEPCAHYGTTPPCAEAIVAAGIRRVVFGAREVNPRARGGGEALRRAGVQVVSGVLEGEVRAQSAHFFHRFAGHARPFVALKLAVSLDARIADRRGRSRWVSGAEAREYVHWLRAGFDAIAVGAGTAAADDPALTVRGPVTPATPPLRVVFDRRAQSREASVVRTARETPTLVVVGTGAPASVRATLEAAGAQVAAADDLGSALAELHRRGVGSVLVEGGGVVAGRLLKEELVDRLHLIVAPIFLGGDGVPAFGGVPGVAIEDVRRWRTVARHTLGNDSLLVLDRP